MALGGNESHFRVLQIHLSVLILNVMRKTRKTSKYPLCWWSWSREPAYTLEAKTDHRLHANEHGEPFPGVGRLGRLPSGWSARAGHTEPKGGGETVATNAREILRPVSSSEGTPPPGRSKPAPQSGPHCPEASRPQDTVTTQGAGADTLGGGSPVTPRHWRDSGCATVPGRHQLLQEEDREAQGVTNGRHLPSPAQQPASSHGRSLSSLAHNMTLTTFPLDTDDLVLK